MHTMKILLILFFFLGGAQALDFPLHVGNENIDGSVVYYSEISSSMPTMINWTTFMREGEGSIQIKPKDDGYRYMFLVIKVKV